MKSNSLATSLLAAALLAGACGTALAHEAGAAHIDRTQHEIGDRIYAGLSSGRLTAREAQSLLERERSLRQREERMRADGRFRPEEKQRLQDELDHLQADVEKLMHNRQTAQRRHQTAGLEETRHRLHARIEQGVHDGRITPREAELLHRRQQVVRRMEADYRADGRLNERERRALSHQLSGMHDELDRMLRNDWRYSDGHSRDDHDYRS